MDYESLMRILVHDNVKGYALNVARSGSEVAMVQKKGNEYVFFTSLSLNFDMLSGFDFLREKMSTETLVISFNTFNVFEAELSHKKMIDGYRVPFTKEVYAIVNGYSILEVLQLLNEKIRSEKQKECESKLEMVKVNNQNMFDLLENQIHLKALEGKVLSVLPDGTNGVWSLNEGGYHICYGDCQFGFDLLESFDCIREEMMGNFLEVSFEENMFVVRLGKTCRDCGYKEPLQTIIIKAIKGNSLFEALASLNAMLKDEKQCEQNTLDLIKK